MMKLKDGVCFLCSNTKVVKSTLNPDIYKIITVLLSNELLNTTEFSRIQPSLRFCPICYHKLIIAERYRENMKSNISNENVLNSNCLLCKNEKNLFEINEWPHFKNILEDLGLLKNRSYVSCSNCLYYLDVKNEIKTRMFSKYPQLRVKSSNLIEREAKPKFTPKIKLKSVPLLEKKNGNNSRKRKLSEVLNSSPANYSLTNLKINFDSVKKFKPLKHDRLLRNHKVVKTDKKFLNQVPYVLVNISNSDFDLNDTYDEDKSTDLSSSTTKQNICSLIETKKDKKRNKKLNMKPGKSRSNWYKRGFEKYLVVNISRIKLEKYFPKDELETDIETSIDECPILQNLNQTEEKSTNNSCETPDILDETENKNKRKSVSFAEDKNIEIEYFENESNTKYRNHTSNNEQSETIGKKYNKGILKRDDNMDESINNSINENEDNLGESEEIEVGSNSSSNNKDGYSDSNSNDANSIESSKELFLETEKELKKNDEKDLKSNKSSNNKDEENIQRTKPKPLSKKKRRYTVTKDIDEKDSDTNYDNQEAGVEEQQKKSISEDTCSEQSIKDNTMEEETVYISDEDDSVSFVDKEKPSSLSTQEMLNIEGSEAEQIGIDSKDINDSSKSNENIKESVISNQSKIYKPKPLSKQKKASVIKEDEERKIEKDLDTAKGNETLHKFVDEEKIEDDVFSEETNISACGTIEPQINMECDSNYNIDNQIDDSQENYNPQNISSTKDDNDQNKNESRFKSVEENEEKLLLETEDKTKFSAEDEINSIRPTSEHATENTTNVLEVCDVLSENSVNDKDKKEDNLTSTSENDISHHSVTQLVDKFLNSDNDEDNFMNTQTNDKTSYTVDNEFYEQLTTEKNISDDKKIDISDNAFSELVKNQDLDTPDADSENTDSIFSHLLFSEGKKKKKVTFCDDVT